MDPDSSDLLAMQLSSSSSSSDTDAGGSARDERTAQSEAEFQAVRRAYRAKVENGEIHRTALSPLSSRSPRVPKPAAQALLHAVEELYFFRRYAAAAQFARAALAAAERGDDGHREAALDGDTRAALRYYEVRCRERADAAAAAAAAAATLEGRAVGGK
ncbi:hypothetical protein GGS23DRAFT_243353 [Durotheca rogersii]|uniref:uncharacterized protein n=1 Tax=Durotheca rogersii TaxID=419775 RepID=UPI00221E4D85|nr:uncharacterized protein GGS23DRAFT_243353 [Durotheca rogersii]KAI5860281.1 hypothetical protein GGS23DRAFT_243353 [Durotheca rogersii]